MNQELNTTRETLENVQSWELTEMSYPRFYVRFSTMNGAEQARVLSPVAIRALNQLTQDETSPFDVEFLYYYSDDVNLVSDVVITTK